MLRHGDLGRQLLVGVEDGLSGLVDWDAAHPAAVPGADLLQLVATEFRRGEHALGPAFLSRPWRLPSSRRLPAGTDGRWESGPTTTSSTS